MTQLKLCKDNSIEILHNGEVIGRFDKYDLERLNNAHSGAILSL